MQYEILKEMNQGLQLAMADGALYVLKEIALEDTAMYQKLKGLDCNNIVRFYDTVALDGRFYVAEEFINGGQTLQDYLDQHGPLSDLEAKSIALQICNGLGEVHRLGIVHRDINPNNIMLAADGTVKIIDFGISRTVKRNQTCDTEILGTQGFTAPEQFGFHQTGPKADIYSVGVLLNVMTTGCLPSVRLVDSWLTEIVLKCTQIDESNRYRNIDDLVLALERRSKLQRFLRAIPGFRRGIWWHQAIAVLYYILLLFCLIFSWATAKSFLDGLTTFGFFVFGFAVPVPILTNYLDWTHRLPGMQNKTKNQRIWIQIVLAVLAEVLSYLSIGIISVPRS